MRAVKTGALVLLVLGMAMALEGLPYFIAPETARRYLQMLSGMEASRLRALGFVMLVSGLALAWWATR